MYINIDTDIDKDIEDVHRHLCMSIPTYMYVCKWMGGFHSRSVWNKSFSSRNHLDLIHCLNEDESNLFSEFR